MVDSTITAEPTLTEDSHSTKNRIISEAGTLFADYGFHGASIKMIADQVGISKPALLHHFETKQVLYDTVQQVFADFAIAHVNAAISSQTNPADQLYAIIDEIASWSDEQVSAIRIFMRKHLDTGAGVGRMDSVLPADERPRLFLTPLLCAVAEVIHRGQKEGLFKKADALTLAYHLVSSLHYHMVALPTLEWALKPSEFKKLKRNFPLQLKQMVLDQVINEEFA